MSSSIGKHLTENFTCAKKTIDARDLLFGGEAHIVTPVCTRIHFSPVDMLRHHRYYFYRYTQISLYPQTALLSAEGIYLQAENWQQAAIVVCMYSI